jgi:hypothetical protein
MKVLDLLNELIVYQPKFAEESMQSNFLNQLVPEDIYEKVVQAHHRSQTKNTIQPEHELIKGKRISKNNSKVVFFETENAYRFNGKIDWYYNKQTQEEYGYIKHEGINDVKFHLKSCVGLEHKDLLKGREIIVTFLKTSHYSKTITARVVNSIAVEDNVLFLLFHFINFFITLSDKTSKDIIDRIDALNVEIDESTLKAVQLALDQKINYSTIEIDKIAFLHNFHNTLQLKNDKLNQKILNLAQEDQFKLWLNSKHFLHEAAPFHQFIIKELNQNPTRTEIIYGKLNNEEKIGLTNDLIDFYYTTEIARLQLPFQILKKYNLSFDYFYHKLKSLSSTDLFALWLKIDTLNLEFELLELDFNQFKIELINHLASNATETNYLLRRFIDDKKINISNSILKLQESNYLLVREVINLLNDLHLTVNEDLISNKLTVKLWYNEIIENFPSKKIIEFLKESSVNRNVDIEIKEQYNALLFKKISVAEFENLIAEIFYSFDTVNNDADYKLLAYLIDSCNKVQYNEEFELAVAKLVEKVYDKASAYYRLKFFIADYTDLLEYHDVVIYTGLLSSEDQKIFFKKTLKLISEDKIEITFEDLQKITTIDYQLIEYAKEIDGVGLDFTLSVILQMTSDLKENKVTTRNTIFDIVASQIKRPEDLLEIKGFFDKCTGTTIAEQVPTKSQPSDIFEEEENFESKREKPQYKPVKKEKILPRFSTFCDGRKAVIKDTETPLLCKKSGFEFWWCENSQCYDVCRKLHPSNDWKNYSFEDVLHILKIPYINSQYEILLNVINRVNRFLAHLSCRKCKTILKPKGKSNFAFHGVTYFSCKNNDCEEHAKEIYLSHCLNGKCEDIIDSRDSPKCKTHGYKDECGWYICKNCNACCSTEKLLARKSILEQFGQEYKCHIEGHRNRGILCCSDCGNEMEEKILNTELYKKQLEWFIEHKDKHANITKYGQRPKDKKWWFIWTRGRFSYDEYRLILKRLFTSGFSIPDFNNKTKDSQLISEPFENTNATNGRTFVCPNCDNTFDFSGLDFAQQNAVRYFHDMIFTKSEI